MDAKLLSKYRNALFGLAALGILIGHANSVISWPVSILRKISLFGGIGVYVFTFLSGMGLYFSMKKSNGGGKLAPFINADCCVWQSRISLLQERGME